MGELVLSGYLDWGISLHRFAFSACKGASVLFAAAPGYDGRVNINFLDSGTELLPLHFSLRFAEGKVVANDRLGDAWGMEVAGSLAVNTETVEHQIAIFFGTRSARLLVDGRTLLRLSNERFQLDSISTLTLGSDVPFSSIRINRKQPIESFFNRTLRLSPSLMIEGQDFDQRLLQGSIKLKVTGSLENFDCITTELQKIVGEISVDVTHVQSILPGFVWRDQDATNNLVIRLLADGRPVGDSLVLSRQDVLEVIEALAATRKPETAVFEALTAVEHVKFGGLFEMLSPTASAFISKTVSLFNLEEYLPIEERGPSETPSLPKQSSIPAVQVVGIQLREEFALGVRATPPRDPVELLTDLLNKYVPGGHSEFHTDFKSDLLLSMAEYFCQINRFKPLFDLWMIHSAGKANFQTDHNWGRSLALPFMFKLRHYRQLAVAMADLAKDRNDWINTACIAWTMKAALGPDRQWLSTPELTSITRAFMHLVEVHAAAYWSRVPCINMVEASAALLLNRSIFPAEQDAAIVAFALRCYGLSRQFWSLIDAAEENGLAEPLAPEIEAGRSAFGTIRAYVEAKQRGTGPTQEDMEAALRFFVGCRTHEAARIRLEVLGPSGIIVPGQPAYLQLASDGHDAQEVLLRHLAFPGTPELPLSLAGRARRAVRERMDGAKLSTTYDLTVRVVRQAHAFLASLKQRQDSIHTTAELDRILGALGQLSGQVGQHVDLAIGLALYTDVLRDGHNEVATKLGLSLLGRLAAVPDSKLKELQGNRLLRSVYTRFATMVERSGSPLSLSLLAQFDQSARLPRRLPIDPRPEMEALWQSACGLFDTLVLVYSCAANLETRIQQVRASWLGKLAELGVPYLIVVGGGKGEIVGDVLYIDAPDTYEGLPRKTVRMLQWVDQHTSFAHVLKVDDDCFLDAEEFFYSLTYRRFNYYGREIKRELGSKPRMWHMRKSATERGAFELDKSPEPAVYADGGSGYTLSREALAALSAGLASSAGARLVQVSYSEDKLVGDLLQMQGIRPRSEDYPTAVLRTTHPGGRAILQWENNFFPGIMSGVKLAHMDNADGLVQRAEEFSKRALFPKKLWPTRDKVRIGVNSNAMELISSEAKLAELAAAPVAVVTAVRNELFMMPHFLAHYRKLGLRSFLIVDNCSDDGTLEYLAEQPDVALFSTDSAYRLAAQGCDWRLALMAHFRVGKWTITVDGDELLLYRGYETRTLEDYLADPLFADADAFLTSMLDMYPKGSLSEATFESGDPFSEAGYVDCKAFRETSLSRGSFANRPTRTSSLRHRLIPGSRPELFVSEKVAMLKYKPWMRFSLGFHYASEVKLGKESMILAHFKYNSEFRAKALREIKRGQYYNNAEEYKKYIDILSEGRDIIYDRNVSIPWRECKDVIEILDRTEEQEWDERSSAAISSLRR